VREWVKAEHLDFLVDPNVKPSDCFAKREQLRKEAELRATARPKSVPTPAPVTP